jgi:hypothetical protein
VAVVSRLRRRTPSHLNHREAGVERLRTSTTVRTSTTDTQCVTCGEDGR